MQAPNSWYWIYTDYSHGVFYIKMKTRAAVYNGLCDRATKRIRFRWDFGEITGFIRVQEKDPKGAAFADSSDRCQGSPGLRAEKPKGYSFSSGVVRTSNIHRDLGQRSRGETIPLEVRQGSYCRGGRGRLSWGAGESRRSGNSSLTRC